MKNLTDQLTGRCMWCNQPFHMTKGMLGEWIACPHCGRETECRQKFGPLAKKFVSWAVIVFATAFLIIVVLPRVKPQALVTRERPPLLSFLQTQEGLIQKYGNPVSKGPARSFSPGELLTFASENLSVSAELANDQCHCISYRLSHPWTDDQISAALSKNGTGWSLIPSRMLLVPRQLRFCSYESREGHRAEYSPVFKELKIRSCEIVARSKEQQEQKVRKQAEIPKF